MWTSQRDLAYCAGLFEGEGNIHFTTVINTLKDGSKGSSNRHLSLTIQMTDLYPLASFEEMLDIGVITGPHKKRGNRKDVYQFRVTGFENTQYVISSIWKWLSPRRKEQAADALSRYTAHKLVRRPYTRGSNR
jgi:hypothetical protein